MALTGSFLEQIGSILLHMKDEILICPVETSMMVKLIVFGLYPKSLRLNMVTSQIFEKNIKVGVEKVKRLKISSSSGFN